ncbi:MAG: hypothetical protein ACD_20C00350G0025 [uncultured bacterium]|nr:MAG: hypothetical protein ACD_20C00350G0025 [uncultured bacterium]HBH17723.1 hypothetical protein [Cyanobacteria bacterium UBA9579]
MMINASQKFSNIINSPAVIKHFDKALTSDAFAARTLLTANAAKTIIGTGFDVYQTIKNDELSRSQKKFITTYGLATGIFTSALQLGTGLTIANNKMQTKIYDKLFGNFKNTSPDLFKKGKTGFAIATSLIVSSVIAKRLIVPFFASICASLLKDKDTKKLSC